jgi:predicted PurR-regulated permease PerM
VIFLIVLSTFVRFVVPSVASELNRMIENLPQTEAALIETKNRLVRNYPTLREPINGYCAALSPTSGCRSSISIS